MFHAQPASLTRHSKSFGFLVLDRLGSFLMFPFFTVPYEVSEKHLFRHGAFLQVNVKSSPLGSLCVESDT